MVPSFLAFAVIPFGDHVTVAGRKIDFIVSDLNIGVLFFLASGSIGVYGVVLAGWASGSKYPLLGGIRSTAQLISYEIALGLVARSHRPGHRTACRRSTSSRPKPARSENVTFFDGIPVLAADRPRSSRSFPTGTSGRSGRRSSSS